MYEELVKRLRELHPEEFGNAWDFAFACQQAMHEAADAIEELQATLCNWCAVCPEGKRDLSTCEIYESCRAKPPKEE